MKNSARLIGLTSVLGYMGILIQMVYSVNRKLDEGFSLIYALNHYFSYFTVVVNFMVATLLLVYIFKPESKLGLWFRDYKNNAAICLYILVVGIIYYTLLVKSWVPDGLEYYATHVLHGYVPIAYFVIWFKQLRTSHLQYKDTLKWLLFPLVYFLYLIVRGEVIHKYPYFFVDVARFGYPKVMLFALGILAFFILLGAALVFLDRKRQKN